MLKKIIHSLLLAAAFLGASAQHVPGSWKVIPMSGSTFEYVQDTPEKVYYLTGGSLYSYDKKNNETVYYSPGTKISDSGISSIKYNGRKGYLVLAYTNGNIDLIYDNGKIVNLPEIKDANLTTSKTINNVSFGKDRMYVATAFGIVVFDDSKHYVVESGVYNENILNIVELGDYIAIWQTGNVFKYSPKRERHNSLNKFTQLGTTSSQNIYPVSDSEYLTLSSGTVYKIELTVKDGVGDLAVTEVVKTPDATTMMPWSNGYYAIGKNAFYMIDSKGTFVEKIAFPAEFGSQTLSFWKSPAEFWSGDASGIGSFSLDNGTATPLNTKYFPNSSRQTRTWWATPTPDKQGVYFSECSQSSFFPNVTFNYDANFLLNHEIYDWTTGEIELHQIKDGGNPLIFGSSRPLYHPSDPNYMLVPNIGTGFYVVDLRTNEAIANFGLSNSILNCGWASRLYDMAFDNEGNLWFLVGWAEQVSSKGITSANIKAITKEGVELLLTDPQKVLESKTDANGKITYPYWLQPSFPTDGSYVPTGYFDSRMVFSSKSNKMILTGGGFDMPICGYDTKGTSRVDDDVYQAYTYYRDQDGTLTDPYDNGWIEEDKNGWIWIGTNVGVFVVKDLNQIADHSSEYLEVYRPKVARNDGTNYADYLLSSDKVICIAVDANNRKWIATTTSGLYLVNEDGTEILQEFNMDNSPLVSNVVTMVACQPNGNDVLIGTPDGLYVYSSDSSPAKDDFSQVYAYPNPVRPDYTGWITINGLMDNSLVKIADPQGNVVWNGRSNGGMVVWDGCDGNGNRVRSGVYMVLASQNENGTSGAVTKIVVIN